jgi:hypothetical protein
MQTTAPVPIFIFSWASSPNLSGSESGSKTLKALTDSALFNGPRTIAALEIG